MNVLCINAFVKKTLLIFKVFISLCTICELTETRTDLGPAFPTDVLTFNNTQVKLVQDQIWCSGQGVS